MPPISLKKLISKKEGLAVISDIVNAMGSNLSIQDTSGGLLIGSGGETPAEKYPVELSGEAIGWVMGDEKAPAVASLLSYLANKELEKKTLASEVLDKYRELTLLYEISNKLTARLDLKEVAFLVIEEARRIIQATSGAVLLLNEKRGSLEKISSFGSSDPKENLKMGEGIAGSVVSSGRGEIVNDIKSDPRFREGEESDSSTICVPMKTKDKAIGAIALSSDSPVTYTAEDLKLLTMLASQAASAIENAILHEKQLTESRREALLFRLANQIRLSLDFDTILETAVSEIRTLLQVDRCLFTWYRPNESRRQKATTSKSGGSEGEELSYPSCRLFHHASGGWEVVKEAKNTELPTLIGYYGGKKIGGWAQQLLDLQILQVDEVEAASDRAVKKFCREMGFKSVLALPLQTRSGALGVVSCSSCASVRPWSDSEVELLQAVANQLAIALDQAELYEQTRNAAATARAQTQQLQQALYELQQIQTQLIQSEKMSTLGALVAGVAHEINNPVNFITGNLSHAKDYIDDLMELLELYQAQCQPTPDIADKIEAIDLEFLMEDLPKLIDSMQLGADRICEIVISLRNFSRLDQSLMKSADIHEGIESTLLILQNRLKATGKRPAIEMIKEYGDLPSVECYAGQLNQVFMNLIGNAIDALEEAMDAPGGMERSPAIRIRTDMSNPEWVAIRIADNGPGMMPEVQQRLFHAFFTTKPVGKGTGLGLSISYSIVVEKHKGTLKCFSEPGEGTEFFIEIPIRAIAESKFMADTQEPVSFAPSSQASLPQAQYCN